MCWPRHLEMLTKTFRNANLRRFVVWAFASMSMTICPSKRPRRGRMSITAGEGSEANGTCGGKNAQAKRPRRGRTAARFILAQFALFGDFLCLLFLHIYAFSPLISATFSKSPTYDLKVPIWRPQRGSLTSSLRPFDSLKEALWQNHPNFKSC